MIDYSQVCQGWIYTITNIVNGKMYVGKTNDYNRRKYEHFHTNEECCILRRAFEKYGRENFKMQSIVTFTAINLNVLNKVLNWLEMYYINKYNTKDNGYNATYGGDGLSGYIHSEETKEKMRKTATGRRHTAESKRKMSISNHSKLGEKSKKPILLYNLNGTFVKEYESSTAAFLDIKGVTKSTAGNIALHNPNSQAYGYLWRYKDSEDFPTQITPYVNPRSKTVYYYTKHGELLDIYSCPKEAARQNDINITTVLCSLSNRKRRIKWALSNYFSYDPPK